jgi:hypothetical protein
MLVLQKHKIALSINIKLSNQKYFYLCQQYCILNISQISTILIEI